MTVYLGAYWYQRPLTLGQYIETTRKFLRELGDFHPVFTQLSEMGDKPNAKVLIRPDGSNLAEIAKERAWDKEARPSNYTNLDANKKPTFETVANIGFHLHFENPEYNKSKRSGVYVWIDAGSPYAYTPSSIGIHFPVKQYPEFTKTEFVSKLYGIVETYWHPDKGIISSEGFRDLTYAQKKTIAAIGWLTYITDKTLIAAVPSDVRTINLSDGVLIVTSEELSSADNPQHVAQATRLRDILQKPSV
jgi:hypothetical protein